MALEVLDQFVVDNLIDYVGRCHNHPLKFASTSRVKTDIKSPVLRVSKNLNGKRSILPNSSWRRSWLIVVTSGFLKYMPKYVITVPQKC